AHTRKEYHLIVFEAALKQFSTKGLPLLTSVALGSYVYDAEKKQKKSLMHTNFGAATATPAGATREVILAPDTARTEARVGPGPLYRAPFELILDDPWYSRVGLKNIQKLQTGAARFAHPKVAGILKIPAPDPN